MKKLWSPTQNMIDNSGLQNYKNWLLANKGLKFDNYADLWSWSISQKDDFWASLLSYFEVEYDGDYDKVSDGVMPNVSWFKGIQLNYVEHLFNHKKDDEIGIISVTELGNNKDYTWREIKDQTSQLAKLLKSSGVGQGDRVIGFLPNIAEASIGFFATCSLGAVWSSCSPDFGAESVIDRFAQIEPKVLIACDGYTYNGKTYNKMDVVHEITEQIPSIELVIIVPFLNTAVPDFFMEWDFIKNIPPAPIQFKRVAFDDPVWVLYSSGTTGNPKAITHGHGGMLLEHLKYMTFHNDVKSGENFFWFATTGWMMWNFVNAAALVGARIVLYEGSPSYPSLDALWEMAESSEIHHFGTSAPFIVACMKRGIIPKDVANLKSLRSIGSTGAPLPPEAFQYVFDNIKKDVWLCSMSGGTDVCTAFVGGCIERDVFMGEIQCRTLGCDLDAWDDDGNSVKGEVGEMVIKQAMPCMPIYFWNDKEDKKYKSSYFEMYPEIWRHGDWIEITERDSLVIRGRSDATLNRHGVRIGTAEIYNIVENFDEISEALVVNLELDDGDHFMPLFLVLNDGIVLNEELKSKISKALKSAYSPRHVPDEILECPAIPTTISGKKMEAPVKKILLGMELSKSINIGAMKNPESIDFFVEYEKNRR